MSRSTWLKPIFLGWVAFVSVFGALSCERERLVKSACREDSDCDAGLICESFECVPAETKACENVIDGTPILQAEPYNIVMGDVDTTVTSRTLTLHNVGNCTLTIFETDMESKGATGFACKTCSDLKFPIEIFPNRQKSLEISFTSTTPGKYQDELVILSDDKEYSEMRIPLSVNFLGVTDLRVTPFPVDFGYVATGLMVPKTIQVTNQGTGIAPVTVDGITLSPAETTHYELKGLPTESTKLLPISSDKEQLLTFELQYHPRNNAQHPVELVLQTSKGEVRVPVTGNSETPPKINVDTAPIDLGEVPLGQTQFQALTLVNEGGAPLIVTYSWGGVGLSTDLFGVPSQLAPIAPGAYVELQVAVTATKVGPINGILLLASNDPSRPQVSIPATATGVPGAGPAVVKMELTYENGTDSAFDEDFRNVDMTLEHPYGFVCNKQTPAPTTWGNFGSPTWISFGPKEEPERIILVNAQQDGKYRVMLQYMQDCASLPTALLSGLLGVAVDVAQVAAMGGVVVPGKDVGSIVEQICLSKKSTPATVKVYINGTLTKETTVTLGKRGDVVYAVDLIRAGGNFTVQ